MNIDDIKNIDDFQVYCCTNNEQRYIYSDMVENATPIADCIDLFIVSGTRSMDNISLCTKLRFLSINNYKIGKKELSNLLDYKENLSTITHLYLWNTKLNDLSLLQLFPNLTHLMVAYIRKEDFSFDGIGYTPKLHTLCILSANKIANMDFIPNDLKKQIKNLSMHEVQTELCTGEKNCFTLNLRYYEYIFFPSDFSKLQGCRCCKTYLGKLLQSELRHLQGGIR